MRAVVQRVKHAEVQVDGATVGAIRRGLCVLVGVGQDDEGSDASWLAAKVTGARVFGDENDKMNLSVAEVSGEILAISQFTLFGDLRQGKRPSFTKAMEPRRAAELFEFFCTECRNRGIPVQTGQFQAHMEVELNNAGPVTLLLDSKKLF